MPGFCSYSSFSIFRVEKPDELVKQSDLPETNDSNVDDIDVYAKQLCQRFDTKELQGKKKRFYTNKPLTDTSLKNIVKNEEPGIISSAKADLGEAKMLSLEESIKIQQQQTKQLKVR